MLECIKNKKSVTLIELVILIVLVAIIGATIAGTIIFFVQLFLYSPRQLDTQKIGQELLYTMIEGNEDARGIRYARSIIDASAVRFSYIYGYPVSPLDEEPAVRFKWNDADSHIYQRTSTDGGSSWTPLTEIPYYISDTVTIDGRQTPSVIFTYKEADDTDWDSGDVDDIRRVIIDITIKTGTGEFSAMEGSTSFTSSVEIKSFED